MVNKLKRYLKIYSLLVKFAMQLETEYRVSFLIELLVEVAYFSATIVSFGVIFANVTEVAGWTRYEMLALLGMNMVLSELILGTIYIHNLRELPGKIIRGDLDLILTKPINALFVVTMWRPYFASVPSVTVGLIVALYSVIQGNLSLSSWGLISGGVIFGSGLVIAYSLGVIISTLAFWFLNATPLPFIAQQLIFLAKNPYDIFTGMWKYVFLTVIPTAVMLTFPIKSALGQLQWWWLPWSTFLAGLFLWVANKVWLSGLKQYSSASS